MKVYRNSRLGRSQRRVEGSEVVIRDARLIRQFRLEANNRISQILKGLQAGAMSALNLQASSDASHILTSAISFTDKSGRESTVDLVMSVHARIDMNDIVGSCSLIIDDGTGRNLIGAGAGWSQVSDWFHENVASSGRNESRGSRRSATRRNERNNFRNAGGRTLRRRNEMRIDHMVDGTSIDTYEEFQDLYDEIKEVTDSHQLINVCLEINESGNWGGSSRDAYVSWELRYENLRGEEGWIRFKTNDRGRMQDARCSHTQVQNFDSYHNEEIWDDTFFNDWLDEILSAF